MHVEEVTEDKKIYQSLYQQIAGKVGTKVTDEFVSAVSRIQWKKFEMIIRRMNSN